MNWNALDIIFSAILVFFVLRGLFRGFFGELFSVGAIALGLGAGYFVGPRFAHTAETLLNLPGWGRVVSFLGVFLVVYVLLKILEKVIHSFVESFRLQNLDKALGLFLGAAEGLILIFLILWGLRAQSFVNVKALVDSSKIARFLVPLLQSVFKGLPFPWG